MKRSLRAALCVLGIGAAGVGCGREPGPDHFARIQRDAVEKGRSPVAHWGNDPAKYTQWGTHSNRLIPVYAFGTRGAGSGVDLDDYVGPQSAYRSEEKVRALYGRLPPETVHPDADYLDQTQLADIQLAAAKAGKKHVFLVVFDGMDWQTTRAAAIAAARRLRYDEGRGTGLHFLDYAADGTTQFGWMVTSPTSIEPPVDVDAQTVGQPPADKPFPLGGYSPTRGGFAPWATPTDPWYLLGLTPDGDDPVETRKPGLHAVPDSSATATAMTTGAKTFNGAVNVDPAGQPLSTVAHKLQAEGWSVGVVTSVPVSHATPAAAYAHNVSRDDFQDLARDLLGLPSVSHPERPLSGMDVVLGSGLGTDAKTDPLQGKNFVPGSRYVTEGSLRAIDHRQGGRYVVVRPRPGVAGGLSVKAAARTAREQGLRLCGVFGVGRHKGHLPFRTANGDYRPVAGRLKTSENYTPAELYENPRLSDLTSAAIEVLSANPKGFWLLVEAGDVDWANHDDNLDNSIGAVHSGDAAVRTITDWVERNGGWKDSLMIVTADHGHHLVLTDPEGLIPFAR